MTNEERQQLAGMLRQAREQLGFTAREVGRRAGVDVGVITKLERCEIGQPRVENVRAIAQALHLPLADIYAMLHWLPSEELPALRPYMRAKYGDLTDADVAEVERFIDALEQRHGTGPIGNEDEH
jgi:transcriptional regulator with XRE-family HTH domain